MKITLEELFQKHIDFAKDQFPLSTKESSLVGLRREIDEVEYAISDYTVIDDRINRKALGFEYVDCFFYLIDSLNRAGFSIEDLKEFGFEKLNINKNRSWEKNNDGSYSHIK